MKKILNKFDTQWGTNFQMAVKGNPDGPRFIDASNSLVTNRHNFAHGKAPTATFLEIKQYYTDVVSLIQILDTIVC